MACDSEEYIATCCLLLKEQHRVSSIAAASLESTGKNHEVCRKQNTHISHHVTTGSCYNRAKTLADYMFKLQLKFPSLVMYYL